MTTVLPIGSGGSSRGAVNWTDINMVGSSISHIFDRNIEHLTGIAPSRLLKGQYTGIVGLGIQEIDLKLASTVKLYLGNAHLVERSNNIVDWYLGNTLMMTLIAGTGFHIGHHMKVTNAGAYDLGQSTKRWANIYGTGLDISGAANIGANLAAGAHAVLVNDKRIGGVADPQVMTDAVNLRTLEDIASQKTTFSDVWNNMVVHGAWPVFLDGTNTAQPSNTAGPYPTVRILDGVAYVKGRRAIVRQQDFSAAAETIAGPKAIYLSDSVVENDQRIAVISVDDADVVLGRELVLAVMDVDLTADTWSNLRRGSTLNGLSFAVDELYVDPYTARIFAYVDDGDADADGYPNHAELAFEGRERISVYLADDTGFWPSLSGMNLGGVDSWKKRWNTIYAVNTNLTGALYLQPTQRLYFDGGGDTYITEGAANLLSFFAGGAQIQFGSSGFRPTTQIGLGTSTQRWSTFYGVDINLSALGKLYLDGGGNTYIWEGTADQIGLVTGGVSYIFTSTQLIPPGASGNVELGRSSNRWSTFYGVSANLTGALDMSFGQKVQWGGASNTPYIYGASATLLVLGVRGNNFVYLTSILNGENSVKPATANVDLGLATDRWSTIYGVAGNLTGQLNMNSQNIINVADPRSGYPQDAATKAYVDLIGSTKTTFSDLWNDMVIDGAWPVFVDSTGTEQPVNTAGPHPTVRIKQGHCYVSHNGYARRAIINQQDFAASAETIAGPKAIYVVKAEPQNDLMIAELAIDDADVVAGNKLVLAIMDVDLTADTWSNLKRGKSLNGYVYSTETYLDPYTARLFAYVDSGDADGDGLPNHIDPQFGGSKRQAVYLADDTAFWPNVTGMDLGGTDSWKKRWGTIYASTVNVAGNIVVTGTVDGVDVSAHAASTANPHSVTKAQVGLGNVENTALSTWAGSTNLTTAGILSVTSLILSKGTGAMFDIGSATSGGNGQVRSYYAGETTYQYRIYPRSDTGATLSAALSLALYYNGVYKKVWHEGTFDPATKANLSGATFTGAIAAPSFNAQTTGQWAAVTGNNGTGGNYARISLGGWSTDYFEVYSGGARRFAVLGNGSAEVALHLTVAGEIYAKNWVRIDPGTGVSGIYWQSGTGQGWHIYPVSTADMRWRSASTTAASVALATSDATIRGYVYADSSANVGFLTSARAWGLRVTSVGNIHTYGHLLPDTSGVYDLGSSTLFHRNLYLSGEIYKDGGTVGFFTTANAAQGVKVGSLVVSASYSNTAPTNGIYVQGAIDAKSHLLVSAVSSDLNAGYKHFMFGAMSFFTDAGNGNTWFAANARFNAAGSWVFNTAGWANFQLSEVNVGHRFYMSSNSASAAAGTAVPWSEKFRVDIGGAQVFGRLAVTGQVSSESIDTTNNIRVGGIAYYSGYSGAPFRGVVVSTSAPSGSYPDGTLWIQH